MKKPSLLIFQQLTHLIKSRIKILKNKKKKLIILKNLSDIIFNVSTRKKFFLIMKSNNSNFNVVRIIQNLNLKFKRF